MKNVVYKESKKSTTARNQRKLKKLKQNSIDIYVVRVNSKGELLESKPCNECLNAMKYTGVDKVYYSTSNGIMVEKVKDMTAAHISFYQETKIQTNIKVWRF